MKKDRPTKSWKAEGTSIMFCQGRRKGFLIPAVIQQTGRTVVEHIGIMPVKLNVRHFGIDLDVTKEDNLSRFLH